jgi:tetratricopeptide (TPR) repeat protein
MNTNHREPPDDLAPLFAATATDAPPPDRALLAALRERSVAEFAAAQSREKAGLPITSDEDHRTTLSTPANSTMFVFRALMGLAATAAVLMAGFFVSRLNSPKATAELTFGDVMRNVALAKSYEAQLIQADRPRKVFATREAMRIETTDVNYVIANRLGRWDVQESENRATTIERSGPSDTLLAIDALGLIGLDLESVAEDRAIGKRFENGRELLYFQCVPLVKGDIELTATVDSKTKLPVSLKVTEGFFGNPRSTVGELHFTSFNQPLDESKLKVAATLTEDGRIGKVANWQGNVALRPLTSARWTPVCDQPILRPGDWLRTDFQGANAVTVQLAPQTTLILGPGSLVQLTKPDQFTLHAGFAEISPATKSDNFSGIVKLAGPNGSTLDVGGVVLVRANEKGLVTNDKPPAWLAGYKGTAVGESLGSLIATIDGRRVPLTVGYHKVSVEIRDQIARTTIEESFVNHTSGVLEGQFHFPLPADASISGFGMWIGDKLVEADIVEKQRAREIYETILREKRDPGLLEWTGGNIFKARVYPIPGKSEKRIKIVYTQVLPRQGGSYRYSYALQSDLLRQNPLRQLDLEVTVSSTQPLAGVTCPTHQTRNQATEHAARVEFSAQKYTPTRDFEVVVQTAGQTPDVVFIPHQRGDDGYFLLQLQPPADAAGWKRDVLPDELPGGEPLDLLVLADTSASMDQSSRRTQGELLAALLGSLSPKDTFNLAMCDVDCLWAFETPQKAEEKAVAAAREQLAKRRSLGWTNLDRAFEAVAAKVQPGTQVVYLGDGIVTTGDMDGPAFVQRLQRLFGGKGTALHAVAVSRSYDQAVLRGIASVGGGSLREGSGEVGPQQTAKNLMAEITRPALRNIQLEFKGIRTARVYPRVLPNVPAGTQQIVLGRYLPQAAQQRGEVVVTGTLDGKLVTYRTTFEVPSTQYSVPSTQPVSAPNPKSEIRNPKSDSDASFIPRLWARMHLDELLAQGTSQEVQDEIINLSEEFHLMTPYTSLLILETDADRERFKVKRRFQMRDGERFFADARDVAQYQLVQQQMQRAGLWRQGLRMNVLSLLADLGRDREVIEAAQPLDQYRAALGSVSLVDGEEFYANDFTYFGTPSRGENLLAWGGGYSMGGVGGMAGRSRERLMLGDRQESLEVAYGGLPLEMAGEPLGDTRPFVTSVVPVVSPFVYDPKPDAPGRPESGEVMARLFKAKAERYDDIVAVNFAKFGEFDGRFMSMNDLDGDYEIDGTRLRPGDVIEHRSLRSAERRLKASLLFEDNAKDAIRRPSLAALFPVNLPPIPHPPRPPREFKSLWSDEAQRVAGLLKQTFDLTKLEAGEGGLLIDEQHDSYFEERGRIDSKASTLRLATAKAWITREAGDNSGPTINWATAEERGVLSVPYELALVRKSAKTDIPQEYRAGEWWQSDLARQYRDRLARVEKPREGQSLLVLIEPLRPQHEARILIDEAKGAALSIEYFQFGKLQGGTRASDFVEVAGVWLAQKVEHFDAQGRNNNVITRKFEVVPSARIEGLVKEQLAPRANALTLRWPLPKLQEAKDRAAAGKATLEDRLRLLIDLASDQKWPEATAELARCEQLIGDKYFSVWLRMWLLQASRRNEELRQLVLTQAKAIAEKDRLGELVLASHLLRVAGDTLSAEEQLTVIDALKPIYARLPEHLQGGRLWGEYHRYQLQKAGRSDEEIALLRELVRDFPDDSGNIRVLATKLAGQGDYEPAYEALRSAIARPGANWPPIDINQIYGTWADLLQQQGRYADQATIVAEWLKHSPTDSDAYERYLAALIYTRREPEALQLMHEWLAAGLAAEPLDEAVVARTEAAVETATGDNSYVSGGDPDVQFLPDMIKLVETHVDRMDGWNFIWQICNDSNIRNREEFRLLGQRLLARLKENAGNYAPSRLELFLNWVIPYAENVPDDDWKAIAAAIRPRWENEPHPVIRDSFAQSLLRVYKQVGLTEKLAFLRLRLEKADDEDKPARARALFDALLEISWTAAIEAETFALIDKLSSGETPADQLRDRIVALHRWVDRMEEARNEVLERGIERPDTLTGEQLEKKRTENRKLVRSDLSARLKGAAAARADGLKPWLLVEHLYLEVRLDREIMKVVENCWELLGVPAAPANADEQPDLAAQLDAALRARVTTMLISLTLRKDAPAAEIDRLQEHLDEQIAVADAGKSTTVDARLAKYFLLVGLDRPQPLAEQLAIWSKGTDRPQVWQRALAYLKAELGQLEEAVALMQPLVAADVLDADDYRTLATWQQTLKHDEQYTAMLLAAWKQMDEWRLRDFVESHRRQWENTDGPSPGAIDPQVLMALQALFEKSTDPGQHVYQVRSFYERSRDFRLLAALADAVIGQSAGSIYRFLKECESTLDVIDREATANELLAHLAKVRQRVKSAVDQRALDLLEMLVERRSAELQNQPGPHAAAAVAALQRAMRPEWSPGEPRLLAQMLADMREIKQPTLAAERINVLRTLHEAVRGQPYDRLMIAYALAESLRDSNQRSLAMDELEPALAEHLQSTGGKRTSAAVESVSLLADLAMAGGNFVRAEQVYRAEAARAANQSVADDLTFRLYGVHLRALREKGSTSYGQGVQLYRTSRDELIAAAERTPDQNVRYRTVDRLCDLFRAAKDYAQLDAAGADAVAFGRDNLPALLEKQIDNYQEMVRQVADTIDHTAGSRAAMEFYIARLEKEPSWIVRRGQDGWRQFGWQIGQLHDQDSVRGKLGEFEPRLLAIVLRELRRELTTFNERQRVLYHRGYGHFWKEKTDDFARVAEEVLAASRDSQRAIMYITDYLYSGIDRPDRAIAVLFDAQRRGLLGEDGRSRLALWLQEQKRFGESIPLLEPLVKANLDSLYYRIRLMHAYFQTKQPEALQTLLAETDKHFHSEDRWSESIAAQLAGSCLENLLLEQAVAYLDEAIKRRTEALNSRTTGDQTIAQYYVDRAYSRAGLKNTKAAVDDAASAIVAWGAAGDGISRRNVRTGQYEGNVHPLDVLKEVLAQSADLDAYVDELDKIVAAENQDRPIVRRAIADVYFERSAFEKALTQYKLAVELAPNDGAIHAQLVACYDALMMGLQAAEQLFASVELARRDIDLWVKLSERLEKLEQPAEAERARTSLVEILPTESEGHAKLAEIRQGQDRWQDAAYHWQQVARIRKLEPGGLLGLAGAQVHLKDRAAADSSLKEVERTKWPDRFRDELNEKLPKLREEWRKLPVPQ